MEHLDHPLVLLTSMLVGTLLTIWMIGCPPPDKDCPNGFYWDAHTIPYTKVCKQPPTRRR